MYKNTVLYKVSKTRENPKEKTYKDVNSLWIIHNIVLIIILDIVYYLSITEMESLHFPLPKMKESVCKGVKSRGRTSKEKKKDLSYILKFLAPLPP